MKRVLLTGGGGGVGVHILGYILENTDWDVVVLDSFRHKGYRDRIETVLRSNVDYTSRIEVIQHDLVCPISPSLKNEIGKIHYILHLAALSDVFFSTENPVYTIRNNVESTLTMLEYAKEIDHEAFIYFSTDEVYGPVKKGEAHVEWDTHRPSNPYSASKAACEDICYSYWRSGDVNLIITNTMNNFGEMQSSSKFPVMVQKAVQKGEKVIIHGNDKEIGTRYYIHSRNVAAALTFILRDLGVTSHIQGSLDDPDRYHIVGDTWLSNLELAEVIADYMGKPLKYKMKDFHKDNPAHDIHYGLQDNKLRKTGWKQPESFEDSMKQTIKWQQENPEWLQ